MRRSKAVIALVVLLTGCAVKTVTVEVPIPVPVLIHVVPVESICEDSEAYCIVV
jgi:hypothetical protein